MVADNASSAGSSQVSFAATVPTSQSNASGSSKSTGLRLRLNRGLLYPVIAQLEYAVDWKLTVVGHIIEALQFAAFFINSQVEWDKSVLKTGGVVNRVIYLFKLPFYDDAFIPSSSSFIVTNIIFWTAFAILLICGIISLVKVISDDQQLPRKVQKVTIVVVQTFSSFLLIPIVSNSVSLMVCNGKRGEHSGMYWFEDRSCIDPLAYVYKVFGAVCIALVSTLAFLASGTLHDDFCVSNAIPARASSSVGHTLVSIKILAAILFHVLASSGHMLAFCATMTAVLFLHGAQYGVLQPYYRHSINKLRNGVFWGLGGVALTACITLSKYKDMDRGISWSDSYAPLILGCVLGAAFGVLGALFPELRVNSSLKKAFGELDIGSTIHDSQRSFPKGLPTNDLVFSAHKSIESHLAPFGNHHPTEDEANRNICILRPYLSRVVFPSDVEVSARFLSKFRKEYGGVPTEAMTSYAARIYTKGMAKFRNNASVMYHFSQFLLFYAHKHRMALTEVETVLRLDSCGIFFGYRVTRLHIRLKGFLNLADSTVLKLLNSSLRLHKEILSHMALFWGKLLYQNVDTVQLAHIANLITSRREQAADQFHRALQTPNNNTLLKYARFLEQVMLDTKTSRSIKDRIAEEAEVRRQQTLRGKANVIEASTFSSNASGTADNSYFEDLERQVEDQNSEFARRTSSIRNLSVTMSIMFVAFVLVAAGSLVYEQLRTAAFSNIYERQRVAGDARTYCGLSAFYANEVLIELNGVTANGARLEALRVSLVGASSKFYDVHRRLSTGDLSSSKGELAAHFTTARVEVLEPDLSNSSLSRGHTRTVQSLWNAGNRLSNVQAQLDAALLPPSGTTTGTTSFLNADRRTRAISASTFIILNFLGDLGAALNQTTMLVESSSLNAHLAYFWVATALFVASQIIVFFVFTLMVVHFQRIASSKLSALSLFSLIPRSYLEQLHQVSMDRVEQFEAEVEEDNGHIASFNATGGQHKPEGPTHPSSTSVPSNKHAPSSSPQPGSAAPPTPIRLKDLTSDGKALEVARPVSDMASWEVVEQIDDKHSESSWDGDRPTEDEPLIGNWVSDGFKYFWNGLMQQIFVLCIALFTVALVAVVFGLVYHMSTLSSKLADAYADRSDYERAHTAMYASVNDLTRCAQGYTINGDVFYLRCYYLERGSEHRVDKTYSSMRDKEKNSGALLLLSQMRDVAASMITRQTTAIWLTSEAYNLTSTYGALLQSLGAHRGGPLLNATSVSAVMGATFASFVVNPSPAQYVDRDVSLSLSFVQKLAVAQSLLNDELYTAHYDLFTRLQQQVLSISSVGQDVSDLYDSIQRLSLGIVILGSLVIVFAMLMFRAYHHTSRGVSGVVAKVGATATAILMLIVVVLTAFSWSHIRTVTDSYDVVSDLGKVRNTTTASVVLPLIQSRAYAQFGEKLYFHRFTNAVTDDLLDDGLDVVRGALLTKGEASIALLNDIVAARRRSVAVRVQLDASILLASWGYYGPNSTDDSRGVGDSLSVRELYAAGSYAYNREYESNYEMDVLRFGVGPTLYSNSTFDRYNLSSAEQIYLAKHNVASVRILKNVQSLRVRIDSVVDGAISTFVSLADNSADALRSVATWIVIVGILLIFVGSLCGMLGVFETMQRSFSTTWVSSGGAARQSDVTTSDSNGEGRTALFANVVFKTRIALILVSFMFAVLYCVDIVSMLSSLERPHRINLASSQEVHLIRSMVLTQNAFRGIITDTPNIQSISESSHVMTTERYELYLGPMGGGRFNVGPYPEFLFGTMSYDQHQYRSDCAFRTAKVNIVSNNPAALPVLSSLAAYGTTLPTTVGAAFMSLGVEDAVTQWLAAFNTIVAALSDKGSSSIPSLVAVWRNPLVATLQLVVDGLSDSTTMFVEAADDRNNVYRDIRSAITAVVLAIIVIELLFVFRPMISLLIKEEEGTKLLLRMIPEQVRLEVPAIAEYLETGAVTQNEKLQKINEVVTEMSTVSLIVCNSKGIIEGASQAALEEFGYIASDLLGHNVKMLMPDSVAQRHDAYLARYRQTGIKRVIDRSRRVTASRKDGSSFVAEILIREFNRHGAESTYLGFIRNATAEVEFEKVTRINEAVSEMSNTPVVVIDPKGYIRRVNKAATDTFGFTSAELIGENVTTLMPRDIAREHDEYLEEYQRTKRKTVVGASRTLRARRKTGEIFPMELTVRELSDDKGTSQYFIGYIKDITPQLRFSQSVLSNEAIIEISPTPVVGILPSGEINLFSPAAQAAWGYDHDEVMGQNVSMLMNDEDAEHHNDYLLRYQRTREKRVIGHTQMFKGKRKSGELFLLEANIQEVQRADHVIYIGFMRDLTDERYSRHGARTYRAMFLSTPAAVVVTDELGSVTHFNPAAEKLLGYMYDQVVGHNVKMLMPDDLAFRHDAHIERYNQTGIKSVLGQRRRTVAKHANGDTLTVELQVHELTIPDALSDSGSRKQYYAYFRDVAEEVSLAKANSANDAILALCTIPMLSINKFGKVLAINAAGSAAFGYDAHEVIGENVSILCPPSIAPHHDEYLQRYRETRNKRILGSTRTVHYRRKDGTLVPAEIKVQEVDVTTDLVFCAYLRDINHEQRLKDAYILSKTAIDACPIPIVLINGSGIVVRFSRAATAVFQWKTEDIVGKNVKVLMHHDIAKVHDQYLQDYRHSGVKRVLDRTRQVQAMRKDGMGITVELSVKEVRRSDLCKIVDDVLGASTHLGLEGGAMQIFSRPGESGADVSKQDAKSRLAATNHFLAMASSFATHALPKGAKGGLASANIQQPDDELFIGYMRDLSQEYILRQSNELKDVILSESSVPMIQLDTKGVILYANPALHHEFGYEGDNLVGRNVKALMPNEVAVNHDGYLERYGRTGIKHIIDHQREAIAKRKDGEQFPIELSVRELNVNGDRTYFGYIRNILQPQLVRDQKRLGDTIMTLSPIPLVVITEEGIIIQFNDAAQEVFGYTQAEAVGANVKTLQPPEVADKHDTYLANYRRTGVKSIVDAKRRVMGKRKNGKSFPLEILIKETTDTDGRVFIGYLRDVSSEKMLQVANDLSDAISTLSPVPLIALDASGTILKFSSAATNDLGYQVEEAMHGNVSMFDPNEGPGISHALHKSSSHALHKSSSPHGAVYGDVHKVRVRRKNGSLYWAECTIREIKQEASQASFVAFIRDVSEENTNEISRSVFKRILNLTYTPMVIISELGIIEHVNESLTETFGYASKDIIGQNIKLLTPPEVSIHHDSFLKAYLTSGLKSVLDAKRKVYAVHKDGTRIVVELCVREAATTEIGKRAYFGFLRDLREETKLHQAFNFNDAITDLSPVPIIAIDSRGTILKFSAASTKVFGYDASEVVRENVKMLMPEPEASNHDLYLERARTRGVQLTKSRRVRGMTKDGKIISLEVTLSEVSHKGVVTSYVGFLRDMTDLDAEEEEGYVSSAIADVADQAIVVTDTRGTIVQMNRSALDLLRYDSLDECVGNNVKMLMTRDYAANHDQYLDTYQRTKVKRIIDSVRRVTALTKTGEVLHVELGVRELNIEGLEPRFLGYLRDVGDEITREVAARMNSTLISLAPVPIILSDASGRIISFSPLASRVFGFSQAEAIGNNLSILMPEEVAMVHDGYLARYHSTGVKSIIDSKRQVLGRHKSGSTFHAILSVRELSGQDDQKFYVAFVSPE